MLNFNFLLDSTGSLVPIFGIVFLFVIMYFFMIRPQKKQQQQDAMMRESLAVGDEVTTIGSIIGKVVSIKEETFVLETTKDRTKIRFLKGAVRSIDVKIADIAAAQAAEKAEAAAPAETEEK